MVLSHAWEYNSLSSLHHPCARTHVTNVGHEMSSNSVAVTQELADALHARIIQELNVRPDSMAIVADVSACARVHTYRTDDRGYRNTG
jgi:hypothetical protein